jgi:hypothetical protein
VLTAEKLVERYSLGWEIELTVKELKGYDELDRIIPCEGKGGGGAEVGDVADTLRETASRQLRVELGVGGTVGTIPTAADGDDFPKRGAIRIPTMTLTLLSGKTESPEVGPVVSLVLTLEPLDHHVNR